MNAIVFEDDFIQLIDGMLALEKDRWTIEQVESSSWYRNENRAKPEQIKIIC